MSTILQIILFSVPIILMPSSFIITISVLKKRPAVSLVMLIVLISMISEIFVGKELAVRISVIYYVISFSLSLLFLAFFTINLKRQIITRKLFIFCFLLILFRSLFLIPLYYYDKSSFEHSVKEYISYPYNWEYCFWHRKECNEYTPNLK